MSRGATEESHVRTSGNLLGPEGNNIRAILLVCTLYHAKESHLLFTYTLDYYHFIDERLVWLVWCRLVSSSIDYPDPSGPKMYLLHHYTSAFVVLGCLPPHTHTLFYLCITWVGVGRVFFSLRTLGTWHGGAFL